MGSNTEGARAALEDMFRRNRAWSTLEAVESGRMYFMEKKLFNLKPNGLWAQAYRVLYETLTKNEA
jgi:ABC-type Fe3+-hydroxamate transport system substrate-binding protein